MIAQKNRFHGRGSIAVIYKKGKTARTEGLTLRYLTSTRNDFRIAVVVSKKVSKSAVVRNRIRRRLYEVIRENTKQAADSQPADMVLSVFDERFATMTAPELNGQVNRLLHRAGLLPG